MKCGTGGSYKAKERRGRSRHESDRGAKRKRLGNTQERKFYVHCKAHVTDPANYARLCDRADMLNGIRRV